MEHQITRCATEMIETKDKGNMKDIILEIEKSKNRKDFRSFCA